MELLKYISTSGALTLILILENKLLRAKCKQTNIALEQSLKLIFLLKVFINSLKITCSQNVSRKTQIIYHPLQSTINHKYYYAI